MVVVGGLPVDASLAEVILNDAPMGVVGLDATGRIQSVNAAAERLFGRRIDPADPIYIEMLLPEFSLAQVQDAEALLAFNALGWSGGGDRHVDLGRADGSTVSIDVQAASSTRGAERAYTLFLQDITPFIAAQNAVAELRQQLIYRWRLNSMGEMGSMIAHELNQPLTAISNYLYVAKTALTGSADGAARKAIEAAVAQAARAGDTIRKLRALLAHNDAAHEAVEVRLMLDELAPLLSLAARERDVRVRIEVQRGDWVICDRVQVQQLVMNLARNAIDAVMNEETRLVVITGAPEASGLYRISIEDSGPGIAPERADLIFAPMTSSKPEGMGLGLSICKTIVEAHGGTISHRPAACGGTVFTFTLRRTARGGSQ